MANYLPTAKRIIAVRLFRQGASLSIVQREAGIARHTALKIYRALDIEHGHGYRVVDGNHPHWRSPALSEQLTEEERAAIRKLWRWPLILGPEYRRELTACLALASVAS